MLKGSSIGANAITNLLNGEDTISVMTGSTINIGLDFGLEAGAKKISAKFAPLVGWFSVGVDIGNFINQLTGGEQLDIGRLINNKLDELRGVTNDLPEILPNGIMKLTMHDGTVYERPLVDIAGNYLLTGENKNDVLFGGNGNDMLIGHGGSDILIGGSGKDDYFVDNGDTIIDSDGKGRVFLGSSHQLKGGTQIEFQKQDEKLKYEKQIKDISVFLENEKDMRENLSELYADTTKAKNYIARLNESGEKSKIELLNSLIKTIQKKQDLTEHILEAKFMLIKANLMAGQDKVCK